jgi:hypothetical protein
VTELEEFLQWVVAEIESVGIPYMVVGSVAAGAHGNPRSTHDVDIVISPSPQQLATAIERFQNSVYADLESAKAAMSAASMFNIIDFRKGLKADLIFLKPRPFDKMEFSRRQRLTAFGSQIWAASAEDVILSKLEWAKMGDSERQYRDAFAVAAMQRDVIDVAYLHRWGVELNVERLLDRLLAEVATAPRIEPPNEAAE